MVGRGAPPPGRAVADTGAAVVGVGPLVGRVLVSGWNGAKAEESQWSDAAQNRPSSWRMPGRGRPSWSRRHGRSSQRSQRRPTAG